MLFGPLHQGADDVLLGVHAAEMVGLGRRVGFVIEERRMAGVCHEIGDVLPLGHLAGVRRRGIKHDDGRTGVEARDDLSRDRADRAVRNREQDDVGAGERLPLIDAVEAGGGLQPGATGLGDLDRGDVEAAALKVGGETNPHLAAGTD